MRNVPRQGTLCLMAGLFTTGLFLSHTEKAERHLERALQEFRKGVIEHPSDNALRNRYFRILCGQKGTVPAKVDFAILARQTGDQATSDLFLRELAAGNKKETEAYLQ